MKTKNTKSFDQTKQTLYTFGDLEEGWCIVKCMFFNVYFNKKMIYHKLFIIFPETSRAA